MSAPHALLLLLVATVAFLPVIDAACTADDQDTRCELGTYAIPCARKRANVCCVPCAETPRAATTAAAVPIVAATAPVPVPVPVAVATVATQSITCLRRVLPIPHRAEFTSCQEYADLLYELDQEDEGARVPWLRPSGFSASDCPAEHREVQSIAVSYTTQVGCRGQTTITVTLDITLSGPPSVKHTLLVETFRFTTKRPTTQSLFGVGSATIQDTQCLADLGAAVTNGLHVDVGPSCDGRAGRLLISYYPTLVREEDVTVGGVVMQRMVRHWDTYLDAAKTQSCPSDRLTQRYNVRDTQAPVIRDIGNMGALVVHQLRHPLTLLVECYSELESFEMESVDNCNPTPHRLKPSRIVLEAGNRACVESPLQGHLIFTQNDASGNERILHKPFIVMASKAIHLSEPLAPTLNLNCPLHKPPAKDLTAYAACAPSVPIVVRHVSDIVTEDDTTHRVDTRSAEDALRAEEACGDNFASSYTVTRTWQYQNTGCPSLIAFTQKIKVAYEAPFHWIGSASDMPPLRLDYQCRSHIPSEFASMRAIRTCTNVITDAIASSQTVDKPHSQCPKSDAMIVRDWQVVDSCTNKSMDYHQVIHVQDTTPPSLTRASNRFCLDRHPTAMLTCFANITQVVQQKFVSGDNCGSKVSTRFTGVQVHACGPEDDANNRDCTADMPSTYTAPRYSEDTDMLCIKAGGLAVGRGLQFSLQFTAKDICGNQVVFPVQIRVPTVPLDDSSKTSHVCDNRDLLSVPMSLYARRDANTYNTVLGQLRILTRAPFGATSAAAVHTAFGSLAIVMCLFAAHLFV